MKSLKNTCLILIAFLFSFSFAKLAFAGEWIADGEKWRYSEEGNFVKGDWREIDGSIYYFDMEGVMATELIKIGKFYHMFYETGRPYSRTEDFFYKNRSYQIGSRGKVLDLETVMNDTEYFKFIVELRTKRAEEAAKAATAQQFMSPDEALGQTIAPASEPVELTEQQKRLAAAEEYKKALKEQEAQAALMEKYRILSLEFRTALVGAANQGNDEASATASLMQELVRQTDIYKTNIVAAVASHLTSGNLEGLNIEEVMSDYAKTIKEYREEIDTDCRIIRERLGMDNTRFVLMKEKFTQFLDKESDALRALIMSLI